MRTDDKTTITLTDPELGTILAALRFWQRAAEMEILDFTDIATNGDQHVALSGGEVDTLCEKLNA